MKKTVIEVPKGIRYLSEWKEFEDVFPGHPHIMDKSITGCGFTDWAITNSWNVILVSPRNILLDNKAEQHPGEVYRVKSEFFDKELGVDKDLEGGFPKGHKSRRKMLLELAEEEEDDEDDEKEEKVVDERKERVNAFSSIDENYTTYKASRGIKPSKILVTYDSFPILRYVLTYRGVMNSFTIIVDEFQSIFTDSRFKSNVEINLLNNLYGLQRVCFVSATPMMDKYLMELDEFKDLPYYELDWATRDPLRTVKPDIDVHCTRSIFEPAAKIIEEYRNGNTESIMVRTEDGNLMKKVVSEEAVLYVNSVNNIIQIIRKNNLTPEEVNILCANTPENRKKITTKLGKKFEIGKVPLMEEPRKMFTLCTRTVYIGADFYSPTAKSYVISDANVESLAVDISLDLPQIMGRQRLWENPWKNSITFYYKLLNGKKKVDPKVFDMIIERKKKETHNLIEAWKLVKSEEIRGSLSRKYKKDAENSNYRDDYVTVCGKDKDSLFPRPNTLVLIADRRGYDIQQIDYKDRFSVISSIYQGNPQMLQTEEGKLKAEINAIRYAIEPLNRVSDRLRFLCETWMSNECREVIENEMPKDIQSYLSLGKDRLKANGYQVSKIKRELGVKEEDIVKQLEERIHSTFKTGDRIPKSTIKERLEQIYNDIGCDRTAKAVDLKEWFNIKEITIGKAKTRGFELL